MSHVVVSGWHDSSTNYGKINVKFTCKICLFHTQNKMQSRQL